MKRLTCEICGSSDLIKEEGVFACQSCGCKYSVEEARKMMVEGVVEIAGTVKVDESEKDMQKIERYLHMAKAASEGMDTDAVVEYSDKVLEIDPENYEAWKHRALAAGWNSSLNNPKTAQVITAAKRCLELAPVHERYEIAEEIYAQGSQQVKSHLHTASKLPGGPSTAEVKHTHFHSTMLNWRALVTQIPYLTPETMQRAIKDCAFFDIFVSDCWKTRNRGVPYSDTMSAALEDKIEAASKECAERREAYWAEHMEEKAKLEEESAAKRAEIAALKDELDVVFENAEMDSIVKQIDSLNEKMSGLGLFAGKEKAALQREIHALGEKKRALYISLKTAKENLEAKIAEAEKLLSEIEERLRDAWLKSKQS